MNSSRKERFSAISTKILFIAGVASVLPSAPLRAEVPADGSNLLLVVDCVLPGEVRRLGRRMTFMSPRRPVRTTGSDCEIRGGEYVSYDRADYNTALAVWLPEAQRGDAKAQTFVGEIYEKGRGQPVDYAAAAQWYARAADHGYGPALINLAHLYSDGLGVPRDLAKANQLALRAANLPTTLATAVTFDPAPPPQIAPPPVQPDPQLAVLKAQNAALAERAAARAADAERLSAQMADLRAQMAAQQAEVTRLQNDKQALARMPEQAARQIAEARAGIAARDRQLSALQTSLHEAERLNAEAQAEQARQAQALKAELAAAESAETARRTQTEAAAAEVARREAAIAEREQAIRVEQARLAALRANIMATKGQGPALDIIEPKLALTRGPAEVGVTVPIKSRMVVGRAISADGSVTVMVNGQKQVTNQQGVFQANVDLLPTTTPVEVVAIDQTGRRSTMAFTFRQIAPAIVQATTVAAPTGIDPSHISVGVQHALLIGNSKYATLPGLVTPAADVDALAKLLRERYGFEVMVLHDATRYQMLSALNALRRTLTEKDDLLVYYAGHGQVQNIANNRTRGYWLPVDAEANNTANWLSTPDITDAVASMNIHKVLLVSDSCYSGLLTRGLARLVNGATPAMRESYLQAMAKARSRNVFTSGGASPVLDGGGGTHSVFAKALITALTQNDQPIQGQDLAKIVQQMVSFAAKTMETDQEPQYGPLEMAGHESGDYVFVPKA